MPFTKHIIEPINVSQCPLPPGEPNELECLSNLTLANVIRQLSSLGQHAGRIFDELTQDAIKLNTRSQILNQRIENLKVKCSQLDIQNEEVSIADVHTKKQYKSSIKIDQQVVSRKTMPEAMRIMYNNADPPPALDKLNPFRSDGKDCMKFYTDPEFFFNIWCNELIKDNETRKIEKKRRKVNKNEKQTNSKSPAQLQINQPYLQHPNVHFAGLDPVNLQPGQPNLPFDPIHLNIQNQQMHYYPTDQQFKNNNNNSNQPAYINDYNDQSLPPPPHQLLQSNHLPGSPITNSNFEIYAESNLSNGNKSNKLIIQQGNMMMMNNNGSKQMHNNQHGHPNERPMLPPPPIPDHNHISDLQQIQQQIIRKFDGLSTRIGQTNDLDLSNNINNTSNNIMSSSMNSDLPPPPSPPNFSMMSSQNGSLITNGNKQQQQQQIINVSLAHTMANLNIMQKSTSSDVPDSSLFDLPPPPPDLQNSDYHIPTPPSPPCNNNNNNHPPLPPPPPLPPLVESDTASSSTSSLSQSTINKAKPSTQPPPAQVEEKSSHSFLDDINKGRFVLKPTQRESNGDDKRKTNGQQDENGRDTIQPFVNNSDVAAIIDFVRKFRPHVGDSTDDEENSDWDE